MFHSKASYSPMDKNNIKPHLNNINIREGVRTATIKDKKLRRKYFTSQIFNIIIILIIVIFQVKTIKTIQKLEEKNIDIERKLFALETFINQTFAHRKLEIFGGSVCTTATEPTWRGDEIEIGETKRRVCWQLR